MFFDYPIFDGTDIIFLSKEDITIGDSAAFKNVMTRWIMLILSERRKKIRSNIVNISYASSDVNSFFFRVTNNFCVPYFKVEAASVYLNDPRNGFLRLSSSTGIDSDLEKKDIVYEPNRRSDVVKSFEDGTMIVRQAQSLKMRDHFKELLANDHVYSMIYAPLRRSPINSDIHENNFGVIKLINPHSGTASGPTSRFHAIDIMEVYYLSELLAVLARNYVRALDAETDLERTVHGIRADIESALHNLNAFNHLVFGDSNSVFSSEFLNSDSYQDYKRLISDAESFIEDLAFQIDKSRNAEKLEIETITNFHAEILMPMINMGRSLQIANSALPLKINNLKASGSLELPPVKGNIAGLISVFRNLLENSIKYCKIDKHPRVNISFSYDEHYVYIKFVDYGIGIRKSDLGYLFSEGYRSAKAKRRNNRGTGVGLSYSQEVVEQLGGQLDCIIIDNGSCFEITLERAR